MSQKHENYEILNLIGYGLAKFGNVFVKEFGFKTKIDFYNFLISKDVAETSGTIKNRQDFFGRKYEKFNNCESKEEIGEFVDKITGYIVMKAQIEEIIDDYFS